MLKYFKKFRDLMGIKELPSNYELELIEKTQNYSKYISWIPWLQMLAVCNSLSMYATKEKWSDIDLFIITSKNRLWSVRILVTLIFHILWVRRHWNKIKERFCLSFFIDETAMNFSNFAIENDVYLYYWIQYLKPIVNKNDTYERFIEANEELWIDKEKLDKDSVKYLIYYRPPTPASFLWRIKLIRNIKTYFWNIFEQICKNTFLPKTLAHKKKLWDPWGLIVGDHILKFHDNDRRREIRGKVVD